MSEVIYQYQQGYVPNNGNTFFFWVDCSKEAYEEEKEEGGTVRKLYTAATPAVLPPKLSMDIDPELQGEFRVHEAMRRKGFNQALALGAQPQKVVELPDIDSITIPPSLALSGNDTALFMQQYEYYVKKALDAANVKWEVKS